MRSIVSILLAIALPYSAQAAWKLDNQNSSLYFSPEKKSSANEVYAFTALKGSLEGNNAILMIDLSYVRASTSIQGELLKAMLFDFVNSGSAIATTAINAAKLKQLKPGETFEQDSMLYLSFHGKKKQSFTTFQVLKLTENAIKISSLQPLMVSAADFNFEWGVEALRTIANLPNMGTTVPVTFSLTFRQ